MMSDFETIKATLKDKWLDYYEANQSWLPILNQEVYLQETRDYLGGRMTVNLIYGFEITPPFTPGLPQSFL